MRGGLDSVYDNAANQALGELESDIPSGKLELKKMSIYTG